MNTSINPFIELLEPFRAELQNLAVSGELVTHCAHKESWVNAVVSETFPSHCASCGNQLVGAAQFLAHGRVWSLNYCAEWMTHDDDHYGSGHMAWLSSIAADDVLTEAQQAEGNAHWTRMPARFLPHPNDPRRKSHPVLNDLAGFTDSLGDDEEEFEAALAHIIGAVIPGTDEAVAQLGRGAVSYLANRIGGTEPIIQNDHGDAVCPLCTSPLTFLGQFDDDIGFHFADGGAIYAFACLAHPQHTLVDCQTH